VKIRLIDIARGLTPPVLWSALSRAKKSLRGSRTKPVLRNVRGVTLLMDPEHALPGYAATHPLYDTALPAFASFLVKRRSRPIVVVDVGANIGDTAALIAAAIGRDNVRFICIEADEAYLPMLRHNTAQLNAELVEAIAGRSSGMVKLVSSRSGRGTSALVADETTDRRMVSLDDLNCGHVDILKVDTDGFDLEVLSGASATLQTTDAVFTEFSPKHLRDYGKCEPQALLDCIRSHGFNAALANDNFGVPIGLFRGSTLDAICNYVDVQRLILLDLLFCRDEELLAEFAAQESERARAILGAVPFS
jgi:FkbM family methyltransferase